MATLTDDLGVLPDAPLHVEQVLTPDVETGTAVFDVLDSEWSSYSIAAPRWRGSAAFIVEAAQYWPALQLLNSGHPLRLVCDDPWHLDLLFVAETVRVSPVSGPRSLRRIDVGWAQVTAGAG